MPLFFFLRHHPFWLITTSHKIAESPTQALFTSQYFILLGYAPNAYLQSLQIARVAIIVCIRNMTI